MDEKKTLEKLAVSSVWYMVDYHPYWLKDGTKNPNVDKNSKAIMSLKTPKKEDEEWKIQKHRAAIKLGYSDLVVDFTLHYNEAS